MTVAVQDVVTCSKRRAKDTMSKKYITYNKMTLNLKDWSRFITKNKNTSLVYGRVYNGWSNIEAVSTPYIPRKK